MSKGFAVTFMIGLLVIGVVIWAVLYKQQGAHIDPKGSILKVRTLKLDDNSSAAVVEVRLANDADYPLVARSIEMTAVTRKAEVPGNMVAEVDVKDLFKNFPLLGEQYNPVLKAREKVPPHGSIDREVCAQFTIPVEDLDSRKDLIVRVEDITGPTAEMHEKVRPKL
jgi:hypothetical protein